MIFIPPARQAGPTVPASTFTGIVFPYVTMPATDGVVINTVNFSPCARTYWHRHERGQIIVVLAGRGLVQAEGGPVRVMRTGDTIWSPPGERHWHGGAADSYVVHTAISLGKTEWEQEVIDEEYGAPVEDER
ncbi:MAG: cupin domain-containing protein [Acidimicrobiales bacterium]